MNTRPVKNRRSFYSFQFRDAVYRVHSEHPSEVSRRIRRLWNELEQFIALHPAFGEAFTPLSPEGAGTTHLKSTDKTPGKGAGAAADLPESAVRMLNASQLTGVGPMAAVAGTFAQLAVEAGQAAGDGETIIENGGDVFLSITLPLTLGLWVGPASPFHHMAFFIPPEMSPLAVCSSSSRLGHSRSFGNCDLVTVFSKNASIADAEATACCNSIQSEEDMQKAVERAVGIDHIDGVIAIKNDKLAIAGQVPELIRHTDGELQSKITRHSEA